MSTINIIINVVAFLVIYNFTHRIFRWIDDKFHKVFFKTKYRITVWSAVTDRATYRLCLARETNTYTLHRTVFKWGSEKSIMRNYFANLHMQNEQMFKENMLVFSEHVIEDVIKHIQEEYSETIIVSRTE